MFTPDPAMSAYIILKYNSEGSDSSRFISLKDGTRLCWPIEFEDFTKDSIICNVMNTKVYKISKVDTTLKKVLCIDENDNTLWIFSSTLKQYAYVLGNCDVDFD